ncbi:hypothetical protein V5P93_003937 [Actinokineospora auranticolor]|uniref:hypothetical protein n=1 Tax=Actinokineospora auranticolor TaxID=155976 RepID=UPI000CEBBD45|nr:hypothetical protein [Actinokineospora auranticolor]
MSDKAAAEAAGMLHLPLAQLAAKDGDADTAGSISGWSPSWPRGPGERATLHYDFGPVNVRAWSLSLAVELDTGPDRAEQITRTTS